MEDAFASYIFLLVSLIYIKYRYGDTPFTIETPHIAPRRERNVSNSVGEARFFGHVNTVFLYNYAAGWVLFKVKL